MAYYLITSAMSSTNSNLNVDLRKLYLTTMMIHEPLKEDVLMACDEVCGFKIKQEM